MVSNADFPQYKEDFLKENPINHGWVLLRRTRDNILSVVKKSDVDDYQDHVIEPFDKTEIQQNSTKQKPGRKATKETETPIIPQEA
jgi:hypothetical protein